MKFENEKIVHSKTMRDYLLSNGGTLLKIKKDLRDTSKEIYIFKSDTVDSLMAGYSTRKGIEQ